jgi:CubicO group peptidase (beta-lactamase class C family)
MAETPAARSGSLLSTSSQPFPAIQELTHELTREFSSLAAAHQVCGAQLAIHRAARTGDDTGAETLSAEFGELEHRSGRPVTRDAGFPIGSITKSFTATLAMILVADGDVADDEPLGRYLPELDDLGDLLTLRQLLSHTAGFACGPDSTDLVSGSLRRYVAEHCRRHNLVLSPGGGFSYSNMGYILAGRLIEEITGMSWQEAMESILLRPLGIAPAFITSDSAGRPVATGHSANLALGRTQPVRQSLAAAEAPAGALAVSALDLMTLGRLFVPPGLPGLLPLSHAGRMRRPVPAADPFGLADGWGLGLAVFGGAANDWAGHDGNADGTACYLRVDPAEGWIIALTTNTTPTGIGLWQKLLARLADAGIPVPPATGQAGHGDAGFEPAVAAGSPDPDYVGTYANGDSEYAVTRAAGRWSLAIDGEEFLVSAGPDGLTFALLDRTSGQRLPGGRFQRDSDTGEITGVVVNGRVARRREYAVAGRG